MKSTYQGYTFPLTETVTRQAVRFVNRYGIELAGDLYLPKGFSGKLPAVAVSGPFGAVKEQASGLYADELASRGFAALAFDPSFVGESGGKARNVASPDINTEDFSAAVDYLLTQDFTDGDNVAILGICGFGGFAVNAASMDTRIKATVATTMYDMPRVISKGYFDANDSAKERLAMKRELNRQRNLDVTSGHFDRAGGVISKEEMDENTPQFIKDYYDYYKTPRGYSERSLNSNSGWNTTSALSLIEMPILTYAEEIESAVLLMHGDKAHSYYFSQDLFKRLKGDNKEFITIEGASHVDLYDNKDAIDFDKIETFLRTYLV